MESCLFTAEAQSQAAEGARRVKMKDGSCLKHRATLCGSLRQLRVSAVNRMKPYIQVKVFLMLLLLAVSTRAQSVKLEQGWQFLADRAGTLKLDEATRAGGWRAAQVGLSWNAQFADLRDYMGVAWYRTSFDVPELKDGRRALVRFGAVDYFSEVYVNGKPVGTHEGGYTPFEFDVTEAVRAGKNELVVRVIDPPMDEKENRARFPGMLYNEIPHGKQNWYVQTGGIWQPVTLEFKPQLYIKGVKVSTMIDGSVSVSVQTNQAVSPALLATRSNPLRGVSAFAGSTGSQTTLDLEVRVLDPSGKAFPLTILGGGRDYITLRGKVPNPQLWDGNHPNLYTVEAKLLDDRFTDRFGFRSFEARDGKFYLNGEPYYMIAALDQDFYPDTIYSSPPEAYVRDMMLKAKQLGLNMLRCHIKVPDPIYLKVADEVGMLVWYEVPSWNDFNHFSPQAAARGEKIFQEMTERDWNHPSIVIQSIINEGWGADLSKEATHRAWLRAAFDRAKQQTAPLARLIVDNSACCNNFHLKTDIEDNHRYNSIPDDHVAFDRWVADFAARPKWNFSPHGDAQPTGREPLVLSEFGNWGLPKLPKELPWWFERGFGDRPVTRPAGVFERFREFQFARLFADYNALAEATQWHQFVSLKHEIEEIRRHAAIQGYVITEFTDINWEANGLMDMWRNPKVYAEPLAEIQQPDLLILRPDKKNYTSGEQISFDALLSHYSARSLNGGELIWRTVAGKKLGSQQLTQQIPRASVATLARQTLTAPEVQRPGLYLIGFKLLDKDQQVISEGGLSVFVYPKSGGDATPRLLNFHDPKNQNPSLKRALSEVDYYGVNTDSKQRPGTLLVATVFDDFVREHLRGGGRAVILADAKDALPSNSNLKITPRAGSDLDGNWVTNFNWARIDAAPFNQVAFTKILGFEAARVVPRHVIEGVGGADYADVHAGIFYGWLNNNHALALQARVGEGRAFLTTFRFEEYGSDPYSTRLLDAIIRYTGSQDFAPRLEMK
jgi:hypothetical protein